MSIKNHPNVHVINLMFKIEGAIIDCLRGEGVKLSAERRLYLAKELAEKAEEVIDEEVKEK